MCEQHVISPASLLFSALKIVILSTENSYQEKIKNNKFAEERLFLKIYLTVDLKGNFYRVRTYVKDCGAENLRKED